MKIYIVWEKTLNEAETDTLEALKCVCSNKKRAIEEMNAYQKWAKEDDQDYEYDFTSHCVLN